MLKASVRFYARSSVEDAMITEVARSPYVLLSVTVLLGSAMYLLALIVG
jgi:hypothetical protein